MEINFSKRPAGVEDLSFDVNGAGASTQYTYGTETYSVSKVNASHIPITAAARLEFGLGGPENVDAAIIAIKAMVEEAGDTLTADTTVAMTETGTSSYQSLIDGQPRNLGGHTLTFQFPNESAIQLSSALTFERFHNGKLVLNSVDGAGTLEYQSTEIYPMFKECTCEIEFSGINIRFGRPNASSSLYGLFFEGCPYALVSNVVFTGHGSVGIGTTVVECQCVGYIGGDVKVTSCTFNQYTSETSSETSSVTVKVKSAGNIGDNITTLTTDVNNCQGTVASLEETVNSKVVGNVDRNYMVVWGKNTNGEFGAGKKANLSYTFLGYPMNCTDASFDGSNGISIFNGKLYTTGLNTNMQLGISGNAQTGWMQQNDFADWTDAEVCNGSCAAIRNKILYTWGNNKYGQLGDGTTEQTGLPKQVMKRGATAADIDFFVDDWYEVELGPGHMLVAADNGSSGYGVYSCGVNKHGQLGSGNTTNRSNLVKVNENDFSATSVASMSAGGMVVDGDAKGLSAVITNLGNKMGILYTWGFGGNGALGNGANTDKNNPSPVVNWAPGAGQAPKTISSTEQSEWLKVSCGARHISALHKNGGVYTAGSRESLGKSALSPSYYSTFSRVPATLDSGDEIVDVKSGYDVTFLLTKNGKVYGYGKNANYSMGIKAANTTTTWFPSAIEIGSGANAIRSGCLCYGGCFISRYAQKKDGLISNYDIYVSGLATSAANGQYTPVSPTAIGTSRSWVNGSYTLDWDGSNEKWRIKISETVVTAQTDGMGEPTEGTWTNNAVVKVYEESDTED